MSTAVGGIDINAIINLMMVIMIMKMLMGTMSEMT